MHVSVLTVIPAPMAEVRTQVLTSRLLEHVAAPVLRFRPLDPAVLPQEWAEGEYLVSMRFLGLVPLGRQVIRTSLPDAPAGEFRVRDDGSGALVRRWDHLIRIRPGPDGTTLYRDEVDVAAGPLTPGIWLFAAFFYRWRQYRWRALARRGFRY